MGTGDEGMRGKGSEGSEGGGGEGGTVSTASIVEDATATQVEGSAPAVTPFGNDAAATLR